MTNNFISIVQTQTLKQQAVRKVLGIPKMRKPKPSKFPKTEKTFRQQVREGT